MNIQGAFRSHQTVASQDERATKLRIFIHGINYPPELIGVGRYTGEFAEYLAEQGHSVEVLTAVPHYPGWWVRPPYKNYRYCREIRNGVRIIRCPLLLHRAGRGIWRMLMPLSFAIVAAPVAFWRILRWRPDIVICIEPTLLSAPAAILAGKITGARRILHVHDLEFDAAFAVGHLNSRIFKQLAGSLDRFLTRRFRTIVTLSEPMRKRLREKRPKPSARVEIIRNWVDTKKIVPLSGPNSFRRELGLSETDFVVLYAGQIGLKQALHLIFQAAQILIDRPDIHFVIAGDGPLKSKFVADYGTLPNVHFLPLQPEERLCELLNLASLHVLPQDRDSSNLVLPSKLGGMLATQRPLLVTADEGSELHMMLKDVAIVVPTGDSKALAEGILTATKSQCDRARLGKLADLFSRERNLPALQQVICL
jgi:colanic acid biosynthesis glycosyl transferase WcaI